MFNIKLKPNSALRSVEAMKDKGFTNDEIEYFLDFINTKFQRPMRRTIIWCTVVLAMLIIFQPELTRQIAIRFMGG